MDWGQLIGRGSAERVRGARWPRAAGGLCLQGACDLMGEWGGCHWRGC